MTIPEDIMKAAKIAVERSGGFPAQTETFALALMAERDRAIDVVCRAMFTAAEDAVRLGNGQDILSQLARERKDCAAKILNDLVDGAP